MILNSLSSQTMEHSMDALWMKMRVTADNIANYETPGYKAKKLTFEEVFRNVEDSGTKASFRTTITADENTSARVDGNNVSMEKEQIELWKTEAQYAMLTQKISGQYSNLRNVISQMSR